MEGPRSSQAALGTMILRWSSRASADMDDIEAFLEARNASAAIRIVDRIVEAIDRLRQFPRLGHDGDLPETRELMVPGTPYFIVYRPEPTAIEIVAVIHGARQWP